MPNTPEIRSAILSQLARTTPDGHLVTGFGHLSNLDAKPVRKFYQDVMRQPCGMHSGCGCMRSDDSEL
jgi:hypothetical protein